jgi:hypothetical protein
LERPSNSTGLSNNIQEEATSQKVEVSMNRRRNTKGVLQPKSCQKNSYLGNTKQQYWFGFLCG